MLQQRLQQIRSLLQTDDRGEDSPGRDLLMAQQVGCGHVSALRRYLNETERGVLDQVEQLAFRKNQLDAHFALQSVLKLWLFVHIPAAVLLLALALWHLLVVNIYAL